MMRGILLGLAFGAALSACSSPHRGTLEPLPDPAVSLVSTHGLPNDTARLIAGGVTADVTGRWSDQGESVEIQYRSAQTPAGIAIASASTWNGRIAPATAAWDRSVTEPGNAIGRPLLKAGPLRLAGNTQKSVQIEFARTGTKDIPAIGDEIKIEIPMPDGARTVRFRVAGE